MNGRISSCALLFALLHFGSTTSVWGGHFLSETNLILNPEVVLVSTRTIEFEATSIEIPNLTMSNPTGGVPAPAVGERVTSFFDIFIELSLTDTHGGTTNYQGMGIGQLDITGVSSETDADGYTRAAFALDLVSFTAMLGNGTGDEVLLRESPTRPGGGGGGGGCGGGGGKGGVKHGGPRESPSRGMIPGSSLYEISTYLDMDLELSFDNGQTWIPA